MYIHALLLAGSVLLQCVVAAAAEAPAFRDHIVFGRSESEEQHALRTAGTARSETLTTTLGTLTDTYGIIACPNSCSLHLLVSTTIYSLRGGDARNRR